jgi:hypothetical protein
MSIQLNKELKQIVKEEIFNEILNSPPLVTTFRWDDNPEEMGLHDYSIIPFKDTKGNVIQIEFEYKGDEIYDLISYYDEFMGYSNKAIVSKRRVIKKENLEMLTKDKMMIFVKELTERGFRSNGVIRMSAGEKAKFTRWANKLQRDPKMVMAGIKATLSRRMK